MLPAAQVAELAHMMMATCSAAACFFVRRPWALAPATTASSSRALQATWLVAMVAYISTTVMSETYHLGGCS